MTSRFIRPDVQNWFEMTSRFIRRSPSWLADHSMRNEYGEGIHKKRLCIRPSPEKCHLERTYSDVLMPQQTNWRKGRNFKNTNASENSLTWSGSDTSVRGVHHQRSRWTQRTGPQNRIRLRSTEERERRTVTSEESEVFLPNSVSRKAVSHLGTGSRCQKESENGSFVRRTEVRKRRSVASDESEVFPSNGVSQKAVSDQRIHSRHQKDSKNDSLVRRVTERRSVSSDESEGFPSNGVSQKAVSDQRIHSRHQKDSKNDSLVRRTKVRERRSVSSDESEVFPSNGVSQKVVSHRKARSKHQKDSEYDTMVCRTKVRERRCITSGESEVFPSNGVSRKVVTHRSTHSLHQTSSHSESLVHNRSCEVRENSQVVTSNVHQRRHRRHRHRVQSRRDETGTQKDADQSEKVERVILTSSSRHSTMHKRVQRTVQKHGNRREDGLVCGYGNGSSKVFSLESDTSIKAVHNRKVSSSRYDRREKRERGKCRSNKSLVSSVIDINGLHAPQTSSQRTAEWVASLPTVRENDRCSITSTDGRKDRGTVSDVVNYAANLSPISSTTTIHIQEVSKCTSNENKVSDKDEVLITKETGTPQNRTDNSYLELISSNSDNSIQKDVSANVSRKTEKWDYEEAVTDWYSDSTNDGCCATICNTIQFAGMAPCECVPRFCRSVTSCQLCSCHGAWRQNCVLSNALSGAVQENVSGARFDISKNVGDQVITKMQYENYAFFNDDSTEKYISSDDHDLTDLASLSGYKQSCPIVID